MPAVVHTIGHSNHPIAVFLALLRRHGIAVVADVRSRPSSRFCPQFNRASLAASLAAAGLGYEFLGGDLGGRSADPAHLRDGRVDYGLVATGAPFRRGLDRVRQLSAGAAVALMCAERDPLDCHRTLLVGVRLRGPDLALVHILADGAAEPHEAAERRLLARHRLDGPDLFRDEGWRLAEAYRRQGAAGASSRRALARGAEKGPPAGS
jgi:uncharacterized protein (DUF488 family)